MNINRLGFWILLLFTTLYAGQVHAKIFLKTITTKSLSGNTEIVAQAAGKDGTMYLVGRFQDGVRLNENPKLEGSGSYLAKQGSDGNWLWIKSLTGDATKAELTCIDVSGDMIALGGVYHRSSGDQKIIWGDEKAVVLHLPIGKQPHGFVMRLDLDGVYKDHGQVVGGGTLPDKAWSMVKSVAIGKDNSVSVGGVFQGALSFGSLELRGNQNPDGGVKDIYVAHLSKSLTWAWATALRSVRSGEWTFVTASEYSHSETVGSLLPIVKKELKKYFIQVSNNVDVRMIQSPSRRQKKSAWNEKLWHIKDLDTGESYYVEGTWGSTVPKVRLKISVPKSAQFDLSRIRVDAEGNTYFVGQVAAKYQPIKSVVHNSSQEVQFEMKTDNSFLLGMIRRGGGHPQLNHEQTRSESALIDLILTREGGYFLGNGRITRRQESFDPIKKVPSLKRMSLGGSAHRFAVVARFSLQQSNILEIDRVAYFCNDTDNVGLSLAADNHNNIYVAGIAREGVKCVYQNGHDQSEVRKSELKVSAPGGRIIPFIVKLNSDLSYAGETIIPADPVEYKLPDFPFPRLLSKLQLSYEFYNVPSRLGFDSTNQMLYWTGNFSNGKLVLGEPNREVKTITLPPGNMGSFITALRSRSPTNFVEEVTLEINSTYGSNLVDSEGKLVSYVEPSLGKLTLLKDRSVTVRVPHRILVSRKRKSDNSGLELDPSGHPIYVAHEVLWDKDDKERPLSYYRQEGLWPNHPRIRYTCMGFDIEDSVVSGTANEHSFRITSDTKINFNWEVEYAIDMVSLVEQATEAEPLIQEAELRTLGNMLYSTGQITDGNLVVGTAKPFQEERHWDWGRTWVPEGQTVEIDVGRFGFELEIPKLDERFVVHSYQGRGSASSSDAAFKPDSTFSLDDFTMTEPTELVFRWRKRLLVKLGPIHKDEARPYPFVKVLRDFGQATGKTSEQDDWYQPYSGLGRNDMPEQWFDYGSSLFIAAPYQPGQGIQLKGWNMAGGHFTQPQGRLPSSLLSEKKDVELRLKDRRKTIPGSYGLEIAALTRSTFVGWDYGDVIFKFDIPIGDYLIPDLLNRSANAEQGTNDKVIVDWEGNKVNRHNMPRDINLNIEPKFTIVAGAPPGSNLKNTLVWDEVRKRLLPLRPGKYLVEFKTGETDRSVFVEVATGFCGDKIPKSAQQDAEEASLADPKLEKHKKEEKYTDIPWLGRGRKRKVIILKRKKDDQEIGILERYLPKLGEDWKQNYKRAHYRHIAGAPVVSLETDPKDAFYFLELVYSQPDTYNEGEYPKVEAGEATVTEGRFTNDIAGRSVLLFSRSDPENPASFPATGDRTQEMLLARIVETRYAEAGKDWNANKPMIDLGQGTIGTPLSSEYDRAGIGTGWLYENGGRQLHDPDIYDRENVKEPIIPVNRRLVEWSKEDGYRDEILVVWYENLTKKTDSEGQVMDEPAINWPWKPVHCPSHVFKWPDGSSLGLIVMASRLGSAGLNIDNKPQLEFLSPRYTDVRIYNQPDPSKVGYNPNEEHAIIAESIFQHALDNKGNPIPVRVVKRGGSNPPPAAFAFRTDLNITQDKISKDPKLSKKGYTSDPYVLVEYFDNQIGEHRMAAYGIAYETDIYRFSYTVKVGEPIYAPYPLNKVIGLSNLNDSQLGTNFPKIDGTYFLNSDTNQATYWIDPQGTAWAISGKTTLTKEPHLFGHFYYPLLTAFWHPQDKPGNKQIWLQGLSTSNGNPDFEGAPGKVRFSTAWPENVPILKVGETLMYPGGEYRADNPATTLANGQRVDTLGLPGVIGWKAGRILFDSRNPTMTKDMADEKNFTARLLNPLMKIEVALDMTKMKQEKDFNPSSEAVSVDGLVWRFNDLPASLQRRVYYDPLGQTSVDGTFVTGKLGIRGYVSGRTLGDKDLTADPDPVYLLEPNIFTDKDRKSLKALFDNSDWTTAVDRLYELGRNPNGLKTQDDKATYLVGLDSEEKLREALEKKKLPFVNPIYKDDNKRIQAASFGPGLALVPNQAIMDPSNRFKKGYITLVENAHPENPDLSPVTIHVVKLEKENRFRGHIKTLLSPNVFDEKAGLSHTGDFGGNVDDLRFEWWYRPAASDLLEHPLPKQPEAKWELLPGEFSNQVVLAGKPSLLLGDNLFFVRYRHKNEPQFAKEQARPFPWEWAGAGNSPQLQPDGSKRYLPQLMMGWVKRVLDAVNPYEARFSDFRNNESPATYASMIQQAGAPYVGPVALNPDKDVIENVGLIPLYQTVLDRARKLSVDLEQPVTGKAINKALLLAATRLSDLYLLLGNEAYSDSQDPTIGIGTSHTDYGSLAPALFAFQNQEASLLHEELALLRGTDYVKGHPVQNRLFWNFVKGQGEAAYATDYNIKDVNNDGFINEYDAKILFPQGHGDAWGHYLSASKAHYTLLQHPYFQWRTRADLYNLMDIVLNADFLDEKKFARTAAAKARAGAEIVNLTFRLDYSVNSQEQSRGLQDRKKERAWGVTEWAKRAGQAALFDWAVANALMPYEAKEMENLDKIDRLSNHDIRVISANHALIQSKLDEANNGLNPLGLVNEAVAFDIDPVLVDRNSPAPATHFEQIYERAVKAAQNAVAVWNYANEADKRLRQVEESVERFRKDALEQDMAYRNRLIEIFGLPYEGTIGPGKPYPEGYMGPDLMLYFYVDQAKVLAEHLPQIDNEEPDEDSEANKKPINFIEAYATFIKYYNDKCDSLKDLKGKFPLGPSPKDPSGHPSDRFDSLFESPEEVVPLKLPFIQGPRAIFAAPQEWGRRKAIGKLQEIYGRLMLTELEYKRKLAEYQQYIKSLEGITETLQHAIDLNKQAEDDHKDISKRIILLEKAKSLSKILSEQLKTYAKMGERTANNAAEALPRVVGFSNDLTAPGRSGIKITSTIVDMPLLLGSYAFLVTQEAAAVSLDLVKRKREIDKLRESNRKAVEKQVREFNSKFKKEINLRLDIYEELKEMEQLGNLFLTTLQEGMSLIDERYAYNKRLASDTQQNRYQDMTFRVMRNDALQKYRSNFDLAARYVYLAAMAYDYETNLEPDQPASAQGLVDDIIRARTLGQWIDGEPRMGAWGLAEILAKLKDNFEVLNGQLGFNNPQTETGRFSLRHELFRIEDGEAGEARWRQKLQSYRVDDLWQVLEFRLYCRPFASPSVGPQPGIVIPFSTEIVEGKNFFGHPAGRLDHVYDPSRYATKIRSVGVWFENYADTHLVKTPRIYLIPTGTDIMRVAHSPTLEQRHWNVIDQRIPVPHKIGHRDLENPNWIPASDSLSGVFTEARRFSRFRAYHDNGSDVFDESEMTWDSRLVGRSVWNTKWLLIIPGSTFHADPEHGLDTFIGGKGSVGGPSSDRNEKGISDIKLLFQTYSHSGY